MGQSLAEGAQSLPLVTDYNTGFNNLRFSMGTHTWTYNMYPDKPELRANSNFLFVPLTAVQRNGLGETIANGMCDHLTQTLKTDFAKKNHFLFSYAGQGGKYIRELNKRHDEAKDPRAGSRRTKGGYYVTSIDDVQRAKRMADSLGMNYSVFAITWMQGEANGTRMYNRWDSVHTLREAINTYRIDLIQLKNDYQKDIKTITRQKNVIPFFTYQTAGNLAGIAQLKACEQEKDMYMVGPTYMLPNASNSYYHAGGKLVHGDGIHLTADGERWLGEQFGKVMRKVIVEKKSWQPLQPEGAWYKKEENAIYVRLNVPNPPLVIDTLFLPKQDKGLGFEIYNNFKTKYSIEKVEVVGNDLLKISMADFISNKDSLLISYGLLPKVADVSQNIKSIRTGMKRSDGHDAIEIEFEGDILREVSLLRKEGSFILNNVVKNIDEYTNLIVRDVFLNNEGNTIFRGEVLDLRKKINFQVGQRCFTSRRYAYGNIHDSDKEKSTFYFKDISYSERAGQLYPMYNWCVIFQDLNVAMQ